MSKFTIRFFLKIIPVILFLVFIEITAAANVKPARIFCSNMVLQQGRENPIWGRADKGERISIQFAGKTIFTKANAAGHWSAKLPALDYGGPYEMVISGSDTIILKNILIGEVWICSGQSNMELSVSNSKNAKIEIQAADFPQIRLFTVAKKYSKVPLEDLEGGEWRHCTPENIKEFSAVAYYFGRSLHHDLKVPVGLIQASWGGTIAESWVSAKGIEGDPELGDKLLQLNGFDMYKNEEQKIVASRILKKEVGSKDAGLVNGIAYYADPLLKESGWSDIDVTKPWEENGYRFIDGIGWYRLTIELTENEAAMEGKIYLGTIDDAEITWINGIEIGSTAQFNSKRIYSIPENTLKKGRNVIAIRVEDKGGAGGLYGNSADKYLKIGKRKISLCQGWKFRITGALNSHVEVDPNSFPTLLFNGMVNPVIPYGIKGAIWYQGESDVDSAKKYQRIFPILITDWRNSWNQGNFPFLFVSLANYQKPPKEPAESNWAELREAQTKALVLPNTGMALAIDLGEESDIHPKNKQEVGRRLALSALKVGYGQNITASGPIFESVRFEEGVAILTFTETASGLDVHNKYGYVNGFSIAGADHKFVWAKAFITGDNTVSVYSEEVKNPVAVRYGWANNPNDLNLYNKEGLPANPFRTDDWPGITVSK